MYQTLLFYCYYYLQKIRDNIIKYSSNYTIMNILKIYCTVKNHHNFRNIKHLGINFNL